jgi:hypothetical protein
MVAGFVVLSTAIPPDFPSKVRGLLKITSFYDFYPRQALFDKRKLRVVIRRSSVVISGCVACVDRSLVKTNKRGTGWDITFGQ